MSYTQINVVKMDGSVVPIKRLTNAHGFVQAVWNRICERFLGNKYAWMHNDGKDLWALVTSKLMPIHWRAVLSMPSDRAIIEHFLLERAANDLRNFWEQTCAS